MLVTDPHGEIKKLPLTRCQVYQVSQHTYVHTHAHLSRWSRNVLRFSFYRAQFLLRFDAYWNKLKLIIHPCLYPLSPVFFTHYLKAAFASLNGDEYLVVTSTLGVQFWTVDCDSMISFFAINSLEKESKENFAYMRGIASSESKNVAVVGTSLGTVLIFGGEMCLYSNS